MALRDGRQARAELRRIRALEVDRNVAGLIAELRSDTDYRRRFLPGRLVIRGYAAQALGRLGDARSVSHLAELIHDPRAQVRESALGALVKLNPEDAGPVFTEGLQDSSAVAKMRAAEGLGRVGGSAAVPDLWKVLELDPDPEVRMYAAEALLELGDDSVRARIPEVMRAISWRVRGHPRWKKLQEAGPG